MELFNMYNNHIVRVLPFVINRLLKEKNIQEDRFKKFLEEVLDTPDSKGFDFYNDNHVKKVFFDYKGSNDYALFGWEKNKENKHEVELINIYYDLPIVFSKHEKEYIRLMLEDKEARCFMSEDLVEKLRTEFDALGGYDVSHITENYIEREIIKHDIDEAAMRKHILVISEALRKKKKISYCYASKDGIFNDTASPFKLIYSLRDRVFRIAVQPEGKKRIILMNINRFKDVKITDIDVNFDPEEQFYKSQRRRLILITENNREKKSVERCMRIFSSYKRRTVYDKSNDEVKIEVDFYRFEQESIINDIISLGSTVQIIGVQRYDMTKGQFVADEKSNLREKVIDRLKKMYISMP